MIKRRDRWTEEERTCSWANILWNIPSSMWFVWGDKNCSQLQHDGIATANTRRSVHPRQHAANTDRICPHVSALLPRWRLERLQRSDSHGRRLTPAEGPEAPNVWLKPQRVFHAVALHTSLTIGWSITKGAQAAIQCCRKTQIGLFCYWVQKCSTLSIKSFSILPKDLKKNFESNGSNVVEDGRWSVQNINTDVFSLILIRL